MRVVLVLGFIIASMAIDARADALEPSPAASPRETTAPTTAPSLSTARHIVARRDWWLALSHNEKLRVVEGEIDGLVNGWWRAFTEYDAKVDFVIIKTDTKANAKTWLSVDKELGELHGEEARQAPKFSKQLHFYIDSIDQFYTTYPHSANVTVGEVLQCLSDKPWKSCADVARFFS